jgi:hypothetical protein
MLPVSRLGTITAEPVDPSPSLGRGELLAGLDAAALKALTMDPIAPLLNVQIRQAGGAFARDTAIAPGPVAEPYGIFMLGLPMDPGAVTARQAELVAALGGQVTGRKLLNLLVPGDSVASVFRPDALARLQAIKRDRDPSGMIRGNYPVFLSTNRGTPTSEYHGSLMKKVVELPMRRCGAAARPRSR